LSATPSLGGAPSVGSRLRAVPAPRSPVYRVGHAPDPLVAPEWAYAKPDGTFGNRFDDPRGARGVATDARFRVLYVASQAAGAYGETVAQFRPSLKLLASLPVAPVGRRPAPVIPRDWRAARRLGVTVLAPPLRFVDVEDAEIVQALRPTLAPVAVTLGLPDVDLSAITGPRRRLTQELALHVYNQVDPSGSPLFAGVRYVSRHHHGWECWAVFADRIAQRVLRVESIAADDPGLYDAARTLGLAIEDDRGGIFTP